MGGGLHLNLLIKSENLRHFMFKKRKDLRVLILSSLGPYKVLYLCKMGPYFLFSGHILNWED